jgi:hypothetical protein
MDSLIPITYNDTKVINRFEEGLLELVTFINSLFKGITRLPLFFAWFIGIILLVTLGTLYTILMYLPLLFARKKIKQNLNELIQDIDSMDQRTAMKLHLAIEEYRSRIDVAVKKGGVFFVMLPITHELKKLSVHIRKAEVKLSHKAYPKRDLTKDQECELVGMFGEWKEGWIDEKMSVYND